VVSWTTHNLLSPDWDRWLAYHGTKEAMNGALSDVLDGLGFRCRRSGWEVRGS
jgi:hypothetical protein